MSIHFNPSNSMLGGYQELDGTIEFYGRVCAILKPTHTVLDLGAVRGAWFFEDQCAYRKTIRDIRSRVERLVGVDVDPIVLTNPTTNENLVIHNGRIPLSDQSVDVILADYVCEHIQNPRDFCAELTRVLKPNGYVCARTPHKYCYVAIIARIIKNSRHSDVLSIAQPDRKTKDIFPTVYRLNTMKDIKAHFGSFEHYSYLYSSEPQYYLGYKYLYHALNWLHRILPKVFVSNIFVFMTKTVVAARRTDAVA
jgi:SAM-dependent methyltransferase